MKQHWRKILVVIGLLLTAWVADNVSYSFHSSNFLHALERFAYDTRLKLTARNSVDSRIIVIDIDEKSLAEQGRWPWPRTKMAQLVGILFDQYQLDTLGFDMVFSEPQQQFSRQEVLSMLQSEKPAEMLKNNQDIVFAKSLENKKIVLGYLLKNIRSYQKDFESVGQLPNSMLDKLDFAPEVNRVTANLLEFQKAANGYGGFFTLEKTEDPDGIIRRVALFNNLNKVTYPSLAMALTERFLGEMPRMIQDKLYPNSAKLSIANQEIAVGIDADVYVPYAKANYATISATDILTGAYEGGLNGKVAILGTSASGLLDLRNTPIKQSYPGVYVHANIIDGLLNGLFKVKTWSIILADFLIAVIVGLLLSIALPFLAVKRSTVLYIVVVSILVLYNWYAWQTNHQIFSIAPILFLATAIFALNVIVGLFRETNAKQQLNRLFGLYVPPEIISEIADQDDSMALMNTQKREMTVLFLDIRDFTTISESMDPENVSAFLNAFFTEMTRIVHKHGGAVDKYMGDSLMAFWGAPLEDSQHAEHAISAALDMLGQYDNINQQFVENNWPEIHYGIGINSGLMSVGNMGSEFRMAYTVVGDAVNLASRLESLTRNYGSNLIVSEFSKSLATEFKYKKLDIVKVKGKSEKVAIYSCQSKEKGKTT